MIPVSAATYNIVAYRFETKVERFEKLVISLILSFSKFFLKKKAEPTASYNQKPSKKSNTGRILALQAS